MYMALESYRSPSNIFKNFSKKNLTKLKCNINLVERVALIVIEPHNDQALCSLYILNKL